jgi:ABC-type spermidine/putrescine transport system permease subunit I
MPDDEKKSTTLVQEMLDKFSALITAAFGLVAALAWNEAIKAFFKEFFGEHETFLPTIIYAIVVTVIAVIITFIVARAISKAKEKSSKFGL